MRLLEANTQHTLDISATFSEKVLGRTYQQHGARNTPRRFQAHDKVSSLRGNDSTTNKPPMTHPCCAFIHGFLSGISLLHGGAVHPAAATKHPQLPEPRGDSSENSVDAVLAVSSLKHKGDRPQQPRRHVIPVPGKRSFVPVKFRINIWISLSMYQRQSFTKTCKCLAATYWVSHLTEAAIWSTETLPESFLRRSSRGD
ncbi:hypothetical protein GWK47_013179 [Chionoecetes opilio]|uniref:Uncharacterized protein n=1 Tax=Chionoecetes opilio TaxID=41210 RepID=A0A8J5CKS2_CHIOP|nr:hypothetical protein GWK47_013179 [Chionoecetes opilio]